MTDEEVKRLATHERKCMAETAIREAEQRIHELMLAIQGENEKLERARERLREANSYLKSIGEEDI